MSKPVGFMGAYLLLDIRNQYRRGEVAKVLGVESVRPDSKAAWRVAVKVEYRDGVEDWIALSDALNGEWLTEDEVEVRAVYASTR